MRDSKLKIAIIGAGGWGTALAALLSGKGQQVVLWSHEDFVVNEINQKRVNSTYLPDVKLSENVEATTNVSDLYDSELYVQAVPTQYIRNTLQAYNFNFRDKIIVNVAKGIEQNSLFRVSDILRDAANIPADRYVILTGPSHAEEVANGIPTTVVAASSEHKSADFAQEVFLTPTFRVYSSDDVIGCELGGSLKNIIAIAAGIIDGLELGDNTKAALITRGLAEMTRLGTMLGANPQTFSGLSGLGDLFVTCNSRHSRNRYVGEQIGKGKSLGQIQSEMKMIAEGVTTTKSAYSLSQKHNVELPIIEQVHKILFENVAPIDAIKELMTRESKREWWW